MKNWKFISRSVEYENRFVKIYADRYLLPDGKEAIYYIRDGVDDVASVFALTKDKKVILAREFRVGPQKVLDELPGGLVDDGEDALAAAKRELLEETGYVSNEWIRLNASYLSAYSLYKKHSFLALECEKVTDKVGVESEFIEVVVKDLQEFMEQYWRGDLTDAETVGAAYIYLKENGEI